MKEINLLGVYVPPLFGDVVLAILIFAPLKWLLDRAGAERWVWHRPLFDLALFVCIVSVVTVGFPASGWL
jgi:hypothetical protein